jgi:hypothetical protein
MPRPSQTERLGLLHGHDSLHDVREQTTEDRGQRTRSVVLIPRRKLAVPIAEDRRKDRPISVLCPLNLVGLGRLERPTSRLSGVRSNQLSYRPKIRDQRTDDR